MDTGNRSSARLMAPIALVVFAILVLVVLASAGGSDKSSDRSGPTKAEQRDLRLRKGRASARPRPTPRSATAYVVKTGDTLGSIAQKTGVPVEKLQELNPTLDPQALVSGQRIKLK